MSILMDALKQQVEPNAGIVAAPAAKGWRNLALLLGFMLALVLGFVLASWWQSVAVPKASTLPTASVQPAPELADSSTIVAALVSAEPEPESVAKITLQRPVQEQLQPQPRVVSVTAPAAEQASHQVTAQPAATTQPEVEVSDELRQRFASAMAASEIDRRQPQPALRAMGAPAKDISELPPTLQRQIPPLRFEAHVYATQSSQRWIKVNGKSLQEGQWVTADIRLKEITPQFVLLEMGSELFSMPALTDYN
ncbi:general secretion pathway protein GspB [Arsukibacterium perlucidum]|uniref:general secretion pathway protein GspB n=1 Tax=Arsukibacterium perlucidum TaxID=368811 RepID=UPI0003A15320|nr:general secretion pathway protein GspB [Arsukibacterium perlucidum]